MSETGIAKAIIIGSIIIGVSVVLGCFVISRAPRFEKSGTLELIEEGVHRGLARPRTMRRGMARRFAGANPTVLGGWARA